MTPEYFELVAKILRAKKPYEWRTSSSPSGWTKAPEFRQIDVEACIKNGWEMRELVVPSIPCPSGYQWHNPLNLSQEVVGKGWRLMVDGEVAPSGYEFFDDNKWDRNGGQHGRKIGRVYCNSQTTCRVPLPHPLPDGRVWNGKEWKKPWEPKFKKGDKVIVSGWGMTDERTVVRPPLENYKERDGGACKDEHYYILDGETKGCWFEESLSPYIPPPQPVFVPLERDDVNFNDIFTNQTGNHHYRPTCIDDEGVYFIRKNCGFLATWKVLKQDYKFKRTGEKEFRPCQKEKK